MNFILPKLFMIKGNILKYKNSELKMYEELLCINVQIRVNMKFNRVLVSKSSSYIKHDIISVCRA